MFHWLLPAPSNFSLYVVVQGPFQGYCVDSDGNQTSGMKYLAGGTTKEKCLELCLRHKDASSCQWSDGDGDGDGGCWKFTGEVARGDDERDWDEVCWILKSPDSK